MAEEVFLVSHLVAQPVATVKKNDVGTVIYIDVGMDVSAANTIGLKVKKPGSTTAVDWAAVIDPDNKHKIKYTIVADDLNVSGVYKLQPYIELTDGGWYGRGTVVELTVADDFV